MSAGPVPEGAAAAASAAPDAPLPPAPGEHRGQAGGAAGSIDSAGGISTIEAPLAPPTSARRPILRRAREWLAEAGRAMDTGVTRIALAATSWLVWPLLYATALGAGAWSLARPSLLSTLDTNKLAEADRRQVVIWIAVAAAGLIVAYLAAIVVARLRSGAWRAVATSSNLNRWLHPVLALPLIAYLRLPSIEKDSQKLTLFLAALCAVIVGRTAYLWSRAPVPVRADADDPVASTGARVWRRVAPWMTALWVLGLWAAYGWFFTHLAITNHHALNTRTTDLGYYDNIFYQSINGTPLGCSFIKAGTHVSAHFDPILVVLSPLYLLHPRAEFLLALQSIWLGSGVVPAYLITRRVLDSRPAGALFAAMLAFYPAMQGANMYEFHSLTLIGPLVLWLLYFFETRGMKRYWLVFAVLLLCREDVPLLLCAVGFYEILTRRPGAARTGVLTTLISVVYFVIVKAAFMKSSGIMNAGKDAYSYDYYYDAMNPSRTGFGGLVASMFTNPVFTLKTALDEPKIVYLLLLFLPLAALPAIARPGRVMLVYGLLFTLLASRAPVFSIHFQYSSVIYPIAFYLAAIALADVKSGRALSAFGLDGARLSRGFLAGALAASVLIAWKFGGVVDNQSFKGGFGRVARGLSNEQKSTYAWVDAQARSIPRAAPVAATSKLGPHISNRQTAVFWPPSVTVDYAFVDESELKSGDQQHQKAIAGFTEIARRGKMALFKRTVKGGK